MAEFNALSEDHTRAFRGDDWTDVEGLQRAGGGGNLFTHAFGNIFVRSCMTVVASLYVDYRTAWAHLMAELNDSMSKR